MLGRLSMSLTIFSWVFYSCIYSPLSVLFHTGNKKKKKKNWKRAKIFAYLFIQVECICSTLGVEDICLSLAICEVTHCCSILFLFWVFRYPHTQLRRFYLLGLPLSLLMWEKIPTCITSMFVFQSRGLGTMLVWRFMHSLIAEFVNSHKRDSNNKKNSNNNKKMAKQVDHHHKHNNNIWAAREQYCTLQVGNESTCGLPGQSIKKLVISHKYKLWGGSPCHHCLGYIITTYDYCGVILHIHTVRYNTSRNVGVLKVENLHCSRRQCVIAEWSGCSVSVRIRARAREWIFLFSLLKKVTKKLCHGRV